MITTGDVLILLERKAGLKARKVLPVSCLTFQDDTRTIFLHKGHPAVVTKDNVTWRDQVFDFLQLSGERLRPDTYTIIRSCCRSHLTGVGSGTCCAHPLDADALRRWGGAWRHDL